MTQATDTVFLVRPCRFQSNPHTAASNAFQAREPDKDLSASNMLAQQQFDGLVVALRRAGVNCLVFDDTPEPHTPDSVFPNNWVSTHPDGRVLLYPMEAVNRRTERRMDIVDALGRIGFDVKEIVDFADAELEGRFLEGTGSLVLDRVNRIAYACRSSRTDSGLVHEVCDRLGYRAELFLAQDREGLPIYHTNVMMFVGSSVAAVCLASIVDEDRARVVASLEATGHEIVDIGFDQMERFAGNMLELKGADGPVIAMSSQALESLTSAHRERLADHAQLVSSDISHIEQQSGGSVRCMLAEVHLPKQT
ncbi:MAG: arginine deiminase-related protein [Pseudomonadota bacterium]